MKGKYKRNEFLMNVSKSRCRSTGVDESLSKLFALLVCLTFDYNEVLCIYCSFHKHNKIYAWDLYGIYILHFLCTYCSFYKHNKLFPWDLYGIYNGSLKWLAILNAHKDLPLIFYLLLKASCTYWNCRTNSQHSTSLRDYQGCLF